MKLLKQIGVVFPITQVMYLVVFYLISASFIIIGMKSGVCAVSVLVIYTVTGVGRCIYWPVSLMVFMRGGSLEMLQMISDLVNECKGYLVIIQLVTLKIAFLENGISSAFSVQTCHPF